MPLRIMTSIRSPKAAHCAGVILGVFLGVVSLPAVMGAFFSAVFQTPLEILTFLVGIPAALTVLPLSVVAIFRPRFAARAIGVSWLLFLIAVFVSLKWRQIGSPSLTEVAMFVLWFFALPGSVVALLMRAAPASS